MGTMKFSSHGKAKHTLIPLKTSQTFHVHTAFLNFLKFT